ncbi:MAG: bifunctional adenosylcobinamide kinase/adenosylcobinamide-phosphate guanylyltransferase [Lachnospiraceae bacterium]|nr:bifunctional adenosylcobinamide kinase/adenosylcobinamide-phosphate guanylyltransferase [Lachnospiraceae bacterium]
MLALITGGSGSGKSAYAEALCVRLQQDRRETPMVYIATMYPFDEESWRKIDRHRELRKNKNFDTVECFTGLKNVELKEHDTTVLLECMSNLTANEMYQEEGAGNRTVEEVCRLIGADSLQYLPLDSLKAMAQNLHLGFCDACFTGDYVLPVPEESSRQLTINND